MLFINRESSDSVLRKSQSFTPANEVCVNADSPCPQIARSNSLIDAVSLPITEHNSLYQEEVEGCDLATFLINRACQNSTLANYFYW